MLWQSEQRPDDPPSELASREGLVMALRRPLRNHLVARDDSWRICRPLGLAGG
jgi:hypothetical protein